MLDLLQQKKQSSLVLENISFLERHFSDRLSRAKRHCIRLHSQRQSCDD
jgi:hypothetical protein